MKSKTIDKAEKILAAKKEVSTQGAQKVIRIQRSQTQSNAREFTAHFNFVFTFHSSITKCKEEEQTKSRKR